MSSIFFIILSLFSPQPLLAQEIAPTPAVDSKAKEVREIVTEMAQKKFNEILNKSSSSSNVPKSIMGTINQLDPTQLTVTYQNETKVITLTDSTVYIDAKRNKTKFESLKSGQDVLALGYFNQYGNFEAKRVVVTDIKTITNNNEIVLGKIADISQSSSIFLLIPIKNKETQYQIKSDSKTEIIDKDNNKLTADKLKTGQKVIVIIQPDIKIAKTFYVSKIITLDTPTAQAPQSPTIN